MWAHAKAWRWEHHIVWPERQANVVCRRLRRLRLAHVAIDRALQREYVYSIASQSSRQSIRFSRYRSSRRHWVLEKTSSHVQGSLRQHCQVCFEAGWGHRGPTRLHQSDIRHRPVKLSGACHHCTQSGPRWLLWPAFEYHSWFILARIPTHLCPVSSQDGENQIIFRHWKRIR